ncbi:cytosolic carboxypeptidase 6-like [Gadus chalcogrammus]|uniref:cytosolic carboxypeptidase 6-like n=1 Tax=Gadus chalcogrammus TaxID=1042646 RepID=UPI0024C4D6C4|nr:cytosolic carboxypeptidase 6-like [Gadus chalcogrammus]
MGAVFWRDGPHGETVRDTSREDVEQLAATCTRKACCWALALGIGKAGVLAAETLLCSNSCHSAPAVRHGWGTQDSPAGFSVFCVSARQQQQQQWWRTVLVVLEVVVEEEEIVSSLQRLPAKNVYYYRCPDHRRNYVMSFAFCFDREDDVYQFAYCYPYTYSRLQHYLAGLERRNLPYLQREQLGLSVQQRRLDLLTITNPAHPSPERGKKLVFLTSRVHPGESPASFVCQGVIDFLVSQHPVAQVLRDHVIFKIVPMLNPDGVYLGNYRCSLMGFDLNRYWQDPSPWAHPTLHAVKQLIVQMNQDPRVNLEFYIDVHAHSTMLNGFMYGNVFEEEERVRRQAVFPRLLCHNAPDFSLSSTSFNRDSVKAGTGRRFLGGLLDDSSYCYTLEVSFYSYMTAGSTAAVPYTEETYMKLGRNVARTFLDYYKLNTLIKDNRPTHIQSSEVMLQTGCGNGKTNTGEREKTEGEKERKSQGIRH